MRNPSSELSQTFGHSTTAIQARKYVSSELKAFWLAYSKPRPACRWSRLRSSRFGRCLGATARFSMPDLTSRRFDLSSFSHQFQILLLVQEPFYEQYSFGVMETINVCFREKRTSRGHWKLVVPDPTRTSRSGSHPQSSRCSYA